MNHQKSSNLFAKAKQVIPGGVNSPVRAFKSVGCEPIFISRAAGSKIFDADDNAYIDYVGSWGPMILGHCHPKVVEAIQKAAATGASFGAPTAGETQLAEMVCDAYPNIEMVRMVSSGTEATMSAIRLARGYTGRDKILKFDGCYHGHADSLLVKAGSGLATFGVPTSPGVPADFATKQEFKEFVDTRLREHGSRFEELSFTSTLTELNGEWAVTYELRYLDKNPVNSSTPLFMTIKGFMYLHPYWKKSVIDAFYSERGTEADLDGTLDSVGQELIDGTSPEMS